MKAEGCSGVSPSARPVAAALLELAASARRVARPGAAPPLLLGAQLGSSASARSAERRLGIGAEREVDREVLGDLVGVEVDVDDPRAGAKRALERREDLGEDVGAADEDRVGLEVIARLCSPNMCPSWPRKSGWAASCSTSDAVRAPDRRPEQLGDARQLGLGARGGDAVADDRERTRPRRAERGCAVDLAAWARRACPACSSARPPRRFVASSTSIGSATKTGPVGRRRGELDRAPQQPQQGRGGVDDPRRPLGHRPGHRDEVGGHLRVHRVVAHAGLAGDHDQRRAAALGAWYIMPIPLPRPTPLCSWTTVGRRVARA